eukprot:TRINITY_DN6533_c0_g1_i1.p1 TRINITY_DN6533_c0_g1~~TRINITY_DN6533_c0_g1_i1.p1  ORF type:complete len:435 (-),score=63.65 TRINITY_DN6533_c0_g1_i1:41-1345(-)
MLSLDADPSVAAAMTVDSAVVPLSVPPQQWWRGARSVAFFAVVALLGITSWVVVNGVWAEVTLLAASTPEGWAIASYVTAAVEASNAAPLALFLTVRTLCPRRSLSANFDLVLIVGLLVWSVAFCALMATLWDVHPFTNSHSWALLACIFCASMASTCSSVVYFPFVSHFPPRYTSALQVGMALSGAVPSLLGFLQAPASDQPRFTVTTFFGVVGGVLVVCAICFVVGALWLLRGGVYGQSTSGAASREQAELNLSESKPPRPMHGDFIENLGRFWQHLLTICLGSCIENGVLTQLITYACMPYGTLTLELTSLLCLGLVRVLLRASTASAAPTSSADVCGVRPATGLHYCSRMHGPPANARHGAGRNGNGCGVRARTRTAVVHKDTCVDTVTRRGCGKPRLASRWWRPAARFVGWCSGVLLPHQLNQHFWWLR